MLRKYTKREIKETIRYGLATDITKLNFTKLNELRKSHDLEKVGYVPGKYGIAAGMLQDRKTGEMFAILERNSALLMMF